MGPLGPDRRRGRPGRPARPGPQVRTSPTAPARAAGTRAGGCGQLIGSGGVAPRSRTWPPERPGSLDPDRCLVHPAGFSASVSGPARALSCNAAHLTDPAHLSVPCVATPDFTGCKIGATRSVAGTGRVGGVPREVVKISVSLVARSHRLCGVTYSSKALRPHSASPLAILDGRDSHRAAGAPIRAPRMRSFWRYKSGCFTRNEYSFTAGLSCKLWPTE